MDISILIESREPTSPPGSTNTASVGSSSSIAMPLQVCFLQSLQREERIILGPRVSTAVPPIQPPLQPHDVMRQAANVVRPLHAALAKPPSACGQSPAGLVSPPLQSHD